MCGGQDFRENTGFIVCIERTDTINSCSMCAPVGRAREKRSCGRIEQ
ncbi:hypothetical protein HMPREF0742_02083 [Rothia aeria F0184]|uniref:Uncharacterized protein n=1 Tax=Rothia aeria F0184 TaxID=888019 RepID=U7V3C1_9MICC|nr:hypothetical protein HMPREF0742_02083 [Rothia aeria F0184]